MQTKRQLVYKGLFHPSGLSVITAILTLILCMVSYCIWVTPESILRMIPRLSAQSNDLSIRLTSNILTLKKSDVSSTPLVFVVGDSTLDEGLDLNALTATLNNAGSSAKVVNLISGGQSILEAMAAIDNLPESAQGVVILGHSLRKLHLDSTQIQIAKKGARRGYTSDAVRNFLNKHGHPVQTRYGLYSLDTFWFAAPRLGGYYFNQLTNREKHKSPVALSRQVLSPQELRRSEAFYMTKVDQTFENQLKKLEVGRDALLTIKKLVAQRHHLKLLLIETSLNPSIVDNQLGSDYYQRYQKSILAFTNQHNISYYNAAAEADLTTTDFRDVLHLIEPAAIERFTHSVASAIVDSLHE